MSTDFVKNSPRFLSIGERENINDLGNIMLIYMIFCIGLAII